MINNVPNIRLLQTGRRYELYTYFKGNISVILSDPWWKDGNTGLTTVPLKALYHVWIRTPYFVLEHSSLSFVDSLQKWLAHFLHIRKTGEIIRIWHFLSEKRRYLPHYWLDSGFKGTIVNRALPSLDEESLKITLSVPLPIFKYKNIT